MGSISQVTLEVPSLFASSLKSATMVCTSRRGGSTSRISPSPRRPCAWGELISKCEPGFSSETNHPAPKLYLLLISGSMIASHRRSGVVRM